MAKPTYPHQSAEALARRIAALGSGPMQEALLSTLEQIDYCQNILAQHSPRFLEKNPVSPLSSLPVEATVGCPGVPGAYTHMACEKLFPRGDIRFYTQFEDVVNAVCGGEVEFGVVPVENSSAGQVNQSLELIGQRGVFVCADTLVKVEHCLCAHPDSDPAAITTALSHPQALLQTARYLRERGLAPEEYSNTAAAAKAVAAAPGHRACVCSVGSAELYGLRIIERNIQDYDENYTRFVCISHRNILLDGAATVALALSFPNRAGELNKLLTRFAVCDLDLCRIQSLPIASRDFSVRFHLDFVGSIRDPRVVSLLGAMYEELEQFVFLGNFLTVE